MPPVQITMGFWTSVLRPPLLPRLHFRAHQLQRSVKDPEDAAALPTRGYRRAWAAAGQLTTDSAPFFFSFQYSGHLNSFTEPKSFLFEVQFNSLSMQIIVTVHFVSSGWVPPVLGVRRPLLQPQQGVSGCAEGQTPDTVTPFLLRTVKNT